MTHIGLIGYFGSEAFSDDLIEHVTKTLIREVEPNAEFDSTLLNRGLASCNPNYLNSFDLIIHCGGSLLGKGTHYPVRCIDKWWNKVKTPLALFGCGYRYEPDKEPLNPESRERMNLLFEKAEVITLRGLKTVQHLKENNILTPNIEEKIISLADPVMAYNCVKGSSGSYIVGNVRSMPSVEVQHVSTEKVQRFMAECYRWLNEIYDLPVMLVSFRHNLEEDNDYTASINVAIYLKEKYNLNVLQVKPRTYLEALNYLNYAKFYLGQRLHPTIVAAVKEIPFIGVEYQFEKMQDWMSTLNCDNYVDMRGSLTLSEFIRKYTALEDILEQLKKDIPHKVMEIKSSVKKILSLIG